MVKTHFVAAEPQRGYVQCNQDVEGKCVLCDTDYKQDTRYLMPVFNTRTESVQVLSIPTTKSPHSLGPQLRTELDRGDLDKRFLWISQDYAKYKVRSMPMPDDAESGEIAIAEFLRMVEEGQVSLESVIPTMRNIDLLDIPEIQRAATAMGLKSKYSMESTSASVASD